MADWSGAIRAVLEQVHPGYAISDGAVAQVKKDLKLLMDAVIDETLHLSMTERVSVAALEQGVKRGLQGELAKHALTEMKEGAQ